MTMTLKLLNLHLSLCDLRIISGHISGKRGISMRDIKWHGFAVCQINKNFSFEHQLSSYYHITTIFIFTVSLCQNIIVITTSIIIIICEHLLLSSSSNLHHRSQEMVFLLLAKISIYFDVITFVNLAQTLCECVEITRLGFLSNAKGVTIQCLTDTTLASWQSTPLWDPRQSSSPSGRQN